MLPTFFSVIARSIDRCSTLLCHWQHTIGFNVVDDLAHNVRNLVLDTVSAKDLLKRSSKDLNVVLLFHLRRNFDRFGRAV